MRKILLSLVLLLALLSAGPAARSGDTGFEGTWELELERFGMHPQTCTGRLDLHRQRGGWGGSLKFDTLLSSRVRIPQRVISVGPMFILQDVEVDGDSIQFVLEHEKRRVAFEGELEDGTIEGLCEWEDLGTFPFEATRIERVRRIDFRAGGKPPFRRVPLSRVGVDPVALDGLIVAAEAAHSDVLLVTKDGSLLCERHFGGKDDAIHLMSVTKFVTAMAVALLLDEGKIDSLDAPLSTWFPEWGEGGKARVTLRHVLAHTSGIAQGGTAKALNQAGDKVAYVRALELSDAPGTKFSYNNEAAALLTGVIRAAAGKPTDVYLNERLFGPLGIEDYVWDRDGAGNALTYAQLQMRARDVAKLGLLLLNDGKWKDRQVFPAQAIERLSTPGSELYEGCGLLWGLVREGGETVGVYHMGYLGQWLVVLFDENIVGVWLRSHDGSEEVASRELGSFLSKLRALSR